MGCEITLKVQQLKPKHWTFNIYKGNTRIGTGALGAPIEKMRSFLCTVVKGFAPEEKVEEVVATAIKNGEATFTSTLPEEEI